MATYKTIYLLSLVTLIALLTLPSQVNAINDSASKHTLKITKEPEISKAFDSLIIILTDGTMYSYNTILKTIDWTANLHLKLMDSFHALDYKPNEKDFTLMPTLDDHVIYISKQDGIYQFSADEIKEGMNLCHDCSTVRYYTESMEKLYFLDIRTGDLLESEHHNINNQRHNEDIVFIRAKGFQVHAFENTVWKEIWNFTTTEIDLLTMLIMQRIKKEIY
jgi:hypothetical protein